MSEPTKILAIDPGITTGYAMFDDQGTCIDYGQIAGVDNLRDFLILQGKDNDVKLIIFEDFKIRPRSSMANGKKRRSDLSTNEKAGIQETLQCIGTIKTIARTFDIDILEVQPWYKEAGYNFLNLQKATNHKESHQRDALAIGYHYLVKNKIVIPKRPEVQTSPKEAPDEVDPRS